MSEERHATLGWDRAWATPIPGMELGRNPRNSHLRIGGASPGLYLQHCLNRNKVLSRERWLERGRVLRRGSGTRLPALMLSPAGLSVRFCLTLGSPSVKRSDVPQTTVGTWVLGSPGRSQGNRISKTPRQVNRTGQNQAQGLGMLRGGLYEKPQDRRVLRCGWAKELLTLSVCSAEPRAETRRDRR